MQMNTAIPGTHLIRHYELIAARNVVKKGKHAGCLDRNERGWFECECGKFLTIRVGNVGAHHTISCGCIGRKQFVAHQERRAANLPKSTRKAMFLDRYKLNRKRSLSMYSIEQKYACDRFLVSFAILAHKRAIEALAALYRGAKNVLDRVERKWLDFVAKGDSMRASRDREKAFLEGMTWRERAMYLAFEAAEGAAAVIAHPLHLRAAMLRTPDFLDVIFVEW